MKITLDQKGSRPQPMTLTFRKGLHKELGPQKGRDIMTEKLNELQQSLFHLGDRTAEGKSDRGVLAIH